MVTVLTPDVVMGRVITEACSLFRASKATVLGRSRARGLVMIRRWVAFACRSRGYSLSQIGQALGGRHHTTIMNLLGIIAPKQRSQPKGDNQ